MKLITKKKIPSYLPRTSGVIQVPIELLNDFLINSPKALRDFASIPTDAITPFYGDLTTYYPRFLLSELDNPFNSITQTFRDDFICDQDKSYQRYMHIDIGINKDSLGISMCHVPEHKEIVRLDDESDTGISHHKLPILKFDFSGRISAREGEQISLSMIRSLIVELRDDRKFPINLITFDRYQSVDSIQILRDLGFVTYFLSIDRTANVVKVNYDKKDFVEKISTDKQYATPHEMVRTAIMDDRLFIPRVYPRTTNISDEEREWTEELEFNSQEFDSIKNVVYKSVHSKDDWIQSIAGSVCNALINELDIYNDPTASSKSDITYEDFDPYNIDDPYENYDIGRF